MPSVPTEIYHAKENEEALQRPAKEAGQKRNALAEVENGVTQKRKVEESSIPAPGDAATSSDMTSDEQSASHEQNMENLALDDVKVPTAVDEQSQSSEPARTVDAIMDPVQCQDYVEVIYQRLFNKECERLPDAQYMSSQNDINYKMRSILVDWLIEVHNKFKLRYETLYVTIRLIDLFLSNNKVSRDRLQLLGVAALMVASKYEEIYTPELQDFVYICDNAYSSQMILDMEESLLQALRFRVTFATPATFLKRFVRAAGGDPTVEVLSRYLLELLLVEPSSIAVQPSKAAAAAVSCALTLTGSAAWCNSLGEAARCNEDDVMGLRSNISSALQSSQNHPLRLKAVFKKYSSDRFFSVSRRFTSL